MFDLTHKIALVTGAKQGMGEAHAHVLARQGAHVIVTDVDKQACENVAADIQNEGGSAEAKEMDVTSDDQVAHVFHEAEEEHDALDILVNNAGILSTSPASELSTEEWERIISVNLTGQFRCAKHAAAIMRKNGYGRIINISSIASGQVGIGIEEAAHYTASKGGIIGMTETLAVEWAEDGITVNAVAPGMIDTEMAAGGASEEEAEGILARVPLGRMGKSEEVSAAVIFLASDEASYTTGSTVYVDGGWLAT